MATTAQVVNYAISLANRNARIDADGAYGSQCVDLINHLSQKFFGRSLWGNAIDYLKSARSAGYPVYGPDHRPRAGAVFVSQIYAHAYGHVGLVVQDSNGSGRLQTVEQNSGASASISAGGPTVRTTTGLSDGIGRVIGYFYFPYSGGVGSTDGSAGGSTSPETPKAKEPTPDEIWRYNDMAISFLFNIKNDPGWNPGTVFFYNGDLNLVQGVHNPEELKYITQAYKDTTNLDLKTYNWDGKVAPVYNRIFGVLQPFSYQEFIERELERLRKYTASYLDIYKKPKKFKSMMTLNVRKEPSKVGEIATIIRPETIHNIESLTTVCDYYWAKITVNGITGWVTMGDITGDMYGELIYE